MIKSVLRRHPNKEMREEFYRYIADKYDSVGISIVGKSMLGEGIPAYKIGTGKYNILSFATHHGLEYICTSSLWLVILDFAKSLTRVIGKSENNFTKYKELFTFWFVPCLNPDGVDINLSGVSPSPLYERIKRMIGEKEPLWQANARGVDLNHNYDYRFAEYKQLESRLGIFPGRTLYSGEYPESEPESRAAANLVRILAPRLVISLHSQGEVIYSFPRENRRVSRIASAFADSLGYSCEECSGTADFSGLSDYAGEVLSIPSLTVELGRGKNPLSYEKLPSISERLIRAYRALPEIIVNKL